MTDWARLGQPAASLLASWPANLLYHDFFVPSYGTSAYYEGMLLAEMPSFFVNCGFACDVCVFIGDALITLSNRLAHMSTYNSEIRPESGWPQTHDVSFQGYDPPITHT